MIYHIKKNTGLLQRGTQLLGIAFAPGAPYEIRDGLPIVLDADIFGDFRWTADPCSPFAKSVKSGYPCATCRESDGLVKSTNCAK